MDPKCSTGLWRAQFGCSDESRDRAAWWAPSFPQVDFGSGFRRAQDSHLCSSSSSILSEHNLPEMMLWGLSRARKSTKLAFDGVICICEYAGGTRDARAAFSVPERVSYDNAENLAGRQLHARLRRLNCRLGDLFPFYVSRAARMRKHRSDTGTQFHARWSFECLLRFGWSLISVRKYK